MKENIKNILTVILSTMILFTSCSDEFLEPDLTISGDAAEINSLASLDALLAGAMNELSNSGFYGRDVVIMNDVRTDNAISSGSSGRFITEGRLQYTATNATALNIWDQGYEIVSICNLIINTEVEDNESPAVQHVKGQAYALRALVHFNLMLHYGQQYVGGTLGVPYVTEFVNSADPDAPARASVADNYVSIKSDLTAAFSSMSAGLNGDNVYPTTYFVKALESRVDLFSGDYPGAKEAAEYVINSEEFDLLSGDAYVDSWSSTGSSHSIFEIGYNDTDGQGINGLFYIIGDTNYGDVVVQQDLYDLYEASDVRSELYSVSGTEIRSLKNTSFSDNIEVITYSEVVLNYAEALSQTSGDALSWLNKITAARGATAYSDASSANIMLERRKELAFQGLRFWDLMRAGQGIPDRGIFSNAIPFGSDVLALPIPLTELNANSNMVQNDGYQQ